MSSIWAKKEKVFSKRRRKIRMLIPGDAALFVSYPEQVMSRDVHHPFRQNPDLFYLTGFSEPDSALLVYGRNQGPRNILFLRDRDQTKEVWTGEYLGIRRAKNRFTVDDVRDFSELINELPKLLKDVNALHYANGMHPAIDSEVSKLFSTQLGPRFDFPNAIKDSRLLTAELRFVKDREEIRAIKHVVDLTAHAMLSLVPQLKSATSELHAAKLLEAEFARLGSPGTAFNTIVASGKHATCLHHSPTLNPLWKREMVLIDAGASFQGYAGDITRTLPISGKYATPHAEIYDIVERALQSAIAAVTPGKTMDDVHQAAVRALTRGLVDLGILKGSVKDNIEEGSYKQFFMHRTGHFLGLDVHDIAPVLYSKAGTPIHAYLRPLEKGNVFTIEPGLYFNPKDRSIPREYRGIGVRIEDDILVSSSGAQVLSSKFPTDRESIEALMD